MMTTNIDSAAPSNAPVSCQLSAGSSRPGSPRGTARGPAHDDRDGYRDQQARDPAVDPADHDHHHDDPDRYRRVRPVHVRERADGVRELSEGLPAPGGDAEHVWQLPDGHLNTHAGQEPYQYGTGQEVGQEA
jgi:hypothetical protein